jgi:hypothetical protein
MAETTEKPNPIAEAKAAAKKAAAELAAKREELKKSIGKSFTDGSREAKVVGFEADKSLGLESGDAYLVNFGNLHRSDYIFADKFLATFKEKE